MTAAAPECRDHHDLQQAEVHPPQHRGQAPHIRGQGREAQHHPENLCYNL